MTTDESAALPEETKLQTLKESKGSPWYDGWTPYCLVPACRGLGRMERRPYGFECPGCGNLIGFDLVRLDDSPLNAHRHALVANPTVRTDQLWMFGLTEPDPVPQASDWRFGGHPDDVTFPAFFYAYDGAWKVTFCANEHPAVWTHWMPAPVNALLNFPPPPETIVR